MRPSLAKRIEAWWDAKPLAAQLVTLIILLLAVGLSLAGTVMIGLLQRHLTSQIDDQLVATAHTIQISASSATFSSDGQGAIPTLYYVHIHAKDGSDRYLYSEDTLKASGTPTLPELVDTSSAPVSSFRTLPVTVASSKSGLGWRALVVPVYDQTSGEFSGYMTIALPLTDVQHTLRTTASYFAVAGSIIVVIGGWAGRYLVRRALLPLRSIESTAGKIAAGDLTKRVTSHPPTTEVGSLALSLNTMLTQVEQSFEARQASEQKIKRFVSDASHELRTPLAAISGYCELYAMGGVPAERTEEVMGRIGSESSRMATLVEDLLTLARLDEGRPLEITDIDLVKLAEHKIVGTKLREVTDGSKVQLGAFDITFFSMTHSIPAAFGIHMKTPAGTLIHSGDFKLDQTPIDGVRPNYAAITKFGSEGLDLLLSDSTNANRPGMTPSEASVGAALRHIIKNATGRVFVASFSSHIHRLQQVCDASVAVKRKVVVTGRSMITNTKVARELGYLNIADKDIIDAYDVDKLADDRIVVLCTGSQGEPLSALARMANGEHKSLSIRPQDTVIISATPVPGNEKSVSGTVLGIDIETTSRFPELGYIVNVGFEFWNLGRNTVPVEPHTAYFGIPEMYKEKGVPLADIHQITWKDVEGKKSFRDDKKAQEALLATMKKIPFMAHNAAFEDSWFMFNIDGYAEARKAGKIIVIDSRDICRRLDPEIRSLPRESSPAALENWARRRHTLAADEKERHLGLEDVDLMIRTVQAEFADHNMFED